MLLCSGCLYVCECYLLILKTKPCVILWLSKYTQLFPCKNLLANVPIKSFSCWVISMIYIKLKITCYLVLAFDDDGDKMTKYCVNTKY